jgi:hypothetical protein
MSGLENRAMVAAAEAARLLFRPILSRRCESCLRTLGRCEPKLCPDCARPASSEPAPPRSSDLAAALRPALERRRVPGSSDAIVLNSGGKDSLYMLVRLRREFPDLRLLSVTYDNGFLNKLSRRNIEQACEALGVESRVIVPDPNIYRALIGEGIRRSDPGGCYRVDCMDGAVFRDLASILAVDLGVPVVLCGHTWAQTRTILGIDGFVLPEDYLRRDRKDYFGIKVADIFPDGGSHIWRGSSVDPDRIPAWFFPMHAWRPDQSEIEARLDAAGFRPERVKQYLTGNALQSLFLLHDWYNRRRFSYEEEAALMLRAGLIDRLEWRRIYALMEIAGRSRLLIRLISGRTMSQLGLPFRILFPRRPKGSP